MARSDLDVCNVAIGRIGGEPIEAIGEDSPLGVFCELNYAPKRDLLLGLYDWVFAKRFAQLNQVTPTPPGTPLTFLYSRPGDLVGEIRAFRDGPSVDAGLVRCLTSNIGVASNHGAVWAEYTAAVPEAQWPVWFADLVSTAFAADLAMRRPDRDLAATLTQEAFGTPEQGGQGGKFLAAMQADGRNAPMRQLFNDDPGPLVEARLGGFQTGLWNRPIVVITGVTS